MIAFSSTCRPASKKIPRAKVGVLATGA